MHLYSSCEILYDFGYSTDSPISEFTPENLVLPKSATDFGDTTTLTQLYN